MGEINVACRADGADRECGTGPLCHSTIGGHPVFALILSILIALKKRHADSSMTDAVL